MVSPEKLSRSQIEAYLSNTGSGELARLLTANGYADEPQIRRSLADTLVSLEGVRALWSSTEVGCIEQVVEAAEYYALARLSEFAAEVLGPALLDGSGGDTLSAYRPLVTARSSLVKGYESTIEWLAAETTGRAIERNESPTSVLPEAKWSKAAFGRGAIGLAQVAYSAGYTLSPADYFGASAMGALALATAAPGADHGIDPSATALAAIETSGEWDEHDIHTRADPTSGGWTVTGEKYRVVSGGGAASYLVVARTGAGMSLFAVDASAEGLQVTISESIDPDRRVARLVLDHAPARLIGSEGAGEDVLRRTVTGAATALVGEQVGLIDGLLKRLSEFPPSGRDYDAWQRFTRELAAMEVARSATAGLWINAIRLLDSTYTADAQVASSAAYIGSCQAVQNVSRRLEHVSEDLDPGIARAFRGRAMTTQFLLGTTASRYERFLGQMGL